MAPIIKLPRVLVRTALLLTTWACFAPVSACGSDDAGPGSVCTPGETRACVGPGACAGGQACLDSGSGWGSCDCGAGGTGNTGGSGGSSSGGTAGTAGVGGNAGSGVDGGVAGAGGTANDAGVDATVPPGPQDDPCPTGAIDLNCSNQCTPHDAKCSSFECGANVVSIDEAAITSASQFPFVVRTPANPGTQFGCTKCVETTPWAINIRSTVTGLGPLKVTVGKPWRVTNVISYDPPCTLYNQPKGCATSSTSYSGFLIATDDPAAPSRNVTISVDSASCVAADFWN